MDMETKNEKLVIGQKLYILQRSHTGFKYGEVTITKIGPKTITVKSVKWSDMSYEFRLTKGDDCFVSAEGFFFCTKAEAKAHALVEIENKLEALRLECDALNALDID